MIKKIGILTFHEGLNHGSFFQALGLKNIVSSLGHNVEIINYKNKHHYLNELKAYFYTKNPLNFYRGLKKLYSFKVAQRKMYLDKLFHDIKSASYFDAIIIGSDTVWNYSDPFLGHDPSYFGHGLKAGKLISYAASFGSSGPIEVIPNYVRDGLNNFNYISVRDLISAKKVMEITGQSPEIVLDPTLLFNWSEHEADIDQEEFVLVYAYSFREEEIVEIRSFAAKKNLKIISIGYYNHWSDINLVEVDPFSWLTYFKKASYVFTSTFHGALFSVIYEKKFFVSFNQYIYDKTLWVLDSFGIDTNKISKISDIENEIDYKKINSNINSKRIKSLEYLQNSISSLK